MDSSFLKIDSSLILFGDYSVAPVNHIVELSAEFFKFTVCMDGENVELKLSFKHIIFVEIVDLSSKLGTGMVFYVNSFMANKIQLFFDKNDEKFFKYRTPYSEHSFFVVEVLKCDTHTFSNIWEVLQRCEAFRNNYVISQYNRGRNISNSNGQPFIRSISTKQWTSLLGIMGMTLRAKSIPYQHDQTRSVYISSNIVPYTFFDIVSYSNGKDINYLDSIHHITAYEPNCSSSSLEKKPVSPVSNNTHHHFVVRESNCSTSNLENKSLSILSNNGHQISPVSSTAAIPQSQFHPRKIVLNNIPSPSTTIRRNTKREILLDDDPLVTPKKDEINAFTYTGQGRDSVTVSYRDLKLLGFRHMLNDVLVDFYLRYIKHELLSPERSQKVYIFTTFFYSRLTQVPPNSRITPSSRPKKILSNYQVVKSWTKKIDLFSMDYIVIPINEDIHWYLAIIVNPSHGIFPVKQENGTLNLDEANLDKRLTLHDITRTSAFKSGPHVIVFDSLVEPFNDRHEHIRDNLAEYLWLEHEAKRKSKNFCFSKSVVKVITPKSLPQQKNYLDCGVFLLQFAELFLSNPPKQLFSNFSFVKWCPEFQIKNKRDEIKKRIMKLSSNVKVSDFIIRLPHSKSKKKKSKKSNVAVSRDGLPVKLDPDGVYRERRNSESDVYKLKRDKKFTISLCKYRSLDSVRGPIEELGLLPLVSDIRRKYEVKKRKSIL